MNYKKEKRIQVKHLRNQLQMIDLERKFRWTTPAYQKAHTDLLNKQEEKVTRQLEKIS